MIERTCHFLDRAQYLAAQDRRLALAYARGRDAAWLIANGAPYGWASLHEVVEPCAMWYATWLFDPDANRAKRDRILAAIADGTFGQGHYLSRFYWERWSDKRPPIGVLCPNGAEWVVDSRSSNGEGWQVTGDVPRITCAPSIVVPGYHGFLRDGVFTESI